MRIRPLSIVAVSLTGHAVLVLGLLVAGLWRLERLDAGRRTVSIGVAPPPPPAPSGGPAGLPAVTLHKKPPATGPRQRSVRPPDPPASAAAGDPGPPGAGSGAGPGDGPGDPRDIGTCSEPPCGDAPQPAARPPEPPKPPPAPVGIAPSVLGGLRISGETQIQPPDPIKIRMVRDGRTRAMPAFKICLAESGAIAGVHLLKSSGYPEYDQLLDAAIHRWVYRPYEVMRHPVPACGVVTFVYSIE